MIYLLLLGFVSYSGTTATPVTGEKGGNITLTCEIEDSEIIHIELINEVSVKTGEELKLDVLLSNADKVQHQSRRNTEWTEIWSRTDGVQRERITIRDRNLIINEFTAREAGTYRVLDPNEEILITVTVTESKEKLDDTDEDKTDDTKYRTVGYWSLAAALTVVLLALILTAVTLLKRWHRGYLKSVASKGKGGLSTEDPEALKDHVDIC